MKKNLVMLACLTAIASYAFPRARTTDVSYGYRMGAGFPGDINRTQPFSAVPGLMNATNPIRLYGDAAIIDSATNSYRGAIATDTTLTKIAGVLVRPYPVQQTSGGMNAAFGSAAAPAQGVIEVLSSGFIMVKCSNFATAQPAKGGAVHLRVAATAGALLQGGFSSAADAANTVVIGNARWNGPGDSNGVAELEVWPA